MNVTRIAWGGARFTTKLTEGTKVFKEGDGARGWPRNDADDHGKGDWVVEFG